MDLKKQKQTRKITREEFAMRVEKLGTFRGLLQSVCENRHEMFTILKPGSKVFLKSGVLLGFVGISFYIRYILNLASNREDAIFLANLEKNRILESRKDTS